MRRLAVCGMVGMYIGVGCGGKTSSQKGSGIRSDDTGGGGDQDAGLEVWTIDEWFGPSEEATVCDGQLWTKNIEARTDENGFLGVNFWVGRNEKSMVPKSWMVVAQSQGGERIMVHRVMDPSGRVVFAADDWNDGTLLTLAAYPWSSDVVLNWPPRSEDGPVEEGKWRVVLGGTPFGGAGAVGTDLSLALFQNEDETTDQGCMLVEVFIASETGTADPDLVLAVETAVAAWQELYSTKGIALSVSISDLALDPALPKPGVGDDLYRNLSVEAAAGSLAMVIGETIGEGSAGRLGQAGNIPGAIGATARSAVTVAWLSHAGADGVLDAEDIDLLAVTMAHEVGHFVGLFHPVHTDQAGGVGYVDALDDTPSCEDWDTCYALLGDNLMYPYSTCAYDELCDGQHEMTDQQLGVMLHYVGVY